MKLFFFSFLFVVSLGAQVKTPSDVYAESIILKKIVEELRLENDVEDKMPYIEIQKDKSPRHVLQ